jgi:hypothetical protein
MDNICDECGTITTDRNNVYGTYCSKCGTFIPTSEAPKFIIEYEYKLKELRKEFLKKFKKSILIERD